MRKILIIAVPVWLLLALPSAAMADNFGESSGGGTSVTFQDDSLISYQFDASLSSRMRAATHWTLTASYATTDLDIVRAADGHSGLWNNHYAVGSMPQPNLLGFHNCITYHSSRRCNHAHLRYANSDLGTVTFERALACHETGHSVGLQHSGPAANSQSVVRCMWNNPLPSTDPLVGPHNVAHINGFY